MTLDSLKELFVYLGIDPFYILVIILLAALAKFGWQIIKRIVLWKNKEWLSKNLRHYTEGDVLEALTYYVPSSFRNNPLAENESPKIHDNSRKRPIIPFLLKEFAKSNTADSRFYLVLADAGIGKTTLLINLFLRYKNKLKIAGAENKIVLFPMSAPEVLHEIESVEGKEHTILLLDALDEDEEVVKNFKKRMNEILKLAGKFRKTLITCRTQFLPLSGEKIPIKPNQIPRYVDYDLRYTFRELYLIGFDQRDIKKYLRKRFPRLLGEFWIRRKARKILENVPDLATQPMLLRRINFLVEDKQSLKYSYQIYERLVDRWMERESSKHSISERYGSSDNYKRLLNEFSLTLAIDLYDHHDERNGYFIEEKEVLKTVLQLEDVQNYAKSEKDFRNRSLLNLNVSGQYKFAHKSILEFFLAKHCFNDNLFLQRFDFKGLRDAEKFYKEMLTDTLSKLEGDFSYSNFDGGNMISLSNLDHKHLTKIKSLSIRALDGFNILTVGILNDLEELIIYDKEKLELLYDLYIARYINSKSTITDTQILKNLERLDLREFYEMLEQLQKLKIQDRVDDIPEVFEKLSGKLGLDKRMRDLNQRKEIRRNLPGSPRELVEMLKPIHEHLDAIEQLKEKLPNCKIFY